MLRIIGIAILLCVGIGTTAYASAQDQPKVVKISDSIYMVPTAPANHIFSLRDLKGKTNASN